MLNGQSLEALSFTLTDGDAQKFVLDTDPKSLYEAGVGYVGFGDTITITAPLGTLVALDLLKFVFPDSSPLLPPPSES